MIQRTILFITACFYSMVLQAHQSDSVAYPEVGLPCPDFMVQGIQYYPNKKASLHDFKGKWLVLDFWNKSCGSCIASFPHMNELQKSLSDQVQVILVGIEDRERQIELIYKKFREKEGLVMPCAFDSALAKRFDIYTAPFIIIIDDGGVVRGITTSVHTDEMRELIKGGSPRLPFAHRVHEDVPAAKITTISYDSRRPLGVANNGVVDSEFIFRSMLSKWKREEHVQSTSADNIEQNVKQGRLEVLGSTLERLYKYAYIGVFGWTSLDSALYETYCPEILLKIKDSSVFKYSFKMNECRNIYSYSLIMPKTGLTPEKMQEAMQQDLERYFGFKATLETRKCPYWRVVASEEARRKVATKEVGPVGQMTGNPKVSYSIKNITFSTVFDYIKIYNPEQVFVDETGLGRVDLKMDCEKCVFVNSVDDVRKALQKNGLGPQSRRETNEGIGDKR